MPCDQMGGNLTKTYGRVSRHIGPEDTMLFVTSRWYYEGSQVPQEDILANRVNCPWNSSVRRLVADDPPETGRSRQTSPGLVR